MFAISFLDILIFSLAKSSVCRGWELWMWSLEEPSVASETWFWLFLLTKLTFLPVKGLAEIWAVGSVRVEFDINLNWFMLKFLIAGLALTPFLFKTGVPLRFGWEISPPALLVVSGVSMHLYPAVCMDSFLGFICFSIVFGQALLPSDAT